MDRHISVSDVLFFLCTSALIVRQRVTNEDQPVLAILKDPKKRRDLKALEKNVGDMPLADTWTFWVNKGQPQAMRENDFVKNIQNSGTCRTLKEFCEQWNALLVQHPLTMFVSVRLFKEHIRPLWEDPANRQGGKWVFVAPCHIDRDVVISLENGDINDSLRSFVLVAVHLIVGALCHYTNMCGIVLTVRSYGFLITLWNNDSSDQTQIDAVKKRLFQLGFKRVKYQSHQITIESNLKRLSDSERIASDTDAVHSSSSDTEKLQLSSEDVERDFTTETDDNNRDSKSSDHGSPEKKLTRGYGTHYTPDRLPKKVSTTTSYNRRTVESAPVLKHSILKHRKVALHSNGELSDTVVNSDTDQILFETDSDGHGQRCSNSSTNESTRSKPRKRLRFAKTPTYLTSTESNNNPSTFKSSKGTSVGHNVSKQEESVDATKHPEDSPNSLSEAQQFTLMSRAGMALLLTASAALASVYSLYLAAAKLNL
jgi:hypothetical protein